MHAQYGKDRILCRASTVNLSAVIAEQEGVAQCEFPDPVKGCAAGRMATTVPRQSPYSKNWKPCKIETKDIGIQGSDAVLQLSVGCCMVA